MTIHKYANYVYPWRVVDRDGNGMPTSYRRKYWGSSVDLTGVDKKPNGKWYSHHYGNNRLRHFNLNIEYDTAEEAMAANDTWRKENTKTCFIPEEEVDKFLGLELLK